MTGLLVSAFINKTNAQCINSTQYPSATTNINSTPGTSVTVTTCNFGGEFSVNNFTATGTYTIDGTGGLGNYFTVTDNLDNPVSGGFGSSVLSVNIPSVGLYRVHITTSAAPACGTDASCHTVKIGKPPVPCSSAPAATVIANSSTLCPGAILNLSVNTTYTGSGMMYQWQSASALAGPYTSISGATLATLATSGPTANIFYQLIATCSVVPVTATATPIQITPGAPTTTAIATPTALCGSTVALSISPSVSGATYQWQSASALAGPYTSISNGTVAAFTATGIASSTFINLVLTCTSNSLFTSVTNTLNVIPAGTTTNSVPYFEGFEGVSPGSNLTNFPNCSWYKDGGWATATSTMSYNRMPKTGSGYVYTNWSTISGGDMLYSNGIQLYTGITYSGTVNYSTDGLTGWTDVSLLLANAQNTSAITNTISTISAPTNTVYAPLTNTFTVASSGIYYLTLKVNATINPYYISFDDFSITAPCSLNSPSISISGSSVICSGSNASLTATGSANTYSWNTGATSNSIAVSPTINTTYSVTGTNSITGCSNTLATTVTVNAAPSISVVGSGTICNGNSATLTASGSANTYSWNTGATSNSIAVSPTINTTYTATGTNSTTGCFNTAISTVSVVTCTEIKNLNSIIGLNVYPNPNNGTFVIELNNNDVKTINITDVTGRVVYSVNTTETKQYININALANGIYFAQISTQGKTSTYKIVKE